MSFKITKKRKIQVWIDEITKLINITLAGKEIPIDLEKLPPQLKEKISIYIKGLTRSTKYEELLARLLRLG